MSAALTVGPYSIQPEDINAKVLLKANGRKVEHTKAPCAKQGCL